MYRQNCVEMSKTYKTYREKTSGCKTKMPTKWTICMMTIQAAANEEQYCLHVPVTIHCCSIVPITFIVLETQLHRAKNEIVFGGWGKFEDVLFIHDENVAQRMFLLLDLMDMNSPLFRPCSSIYFLLKTMRL